MDLPEVPTGEEIGVWFRTVWEVIYADPWKALPAVLVVAIPIMAWRGNLANFVNAIAGVIRALRGQK